MIQHVCLVTVCGTNQNRESHQHEHDEASRQREKSTTEYPSTTDLELALIKLFGLVGVLR